MFPFFNAIVTVLRNTVTMKPVSYPYTYIQIGALNCDHTSLGPGQLYSRFCAGKCLLSSYGLDGVWQGKGIKIGRQLAQFASQLLCAALGSSWGSPEKVLAKVGKGRMAKGGKYISSAAAGSPIGWRKCRKVLSGEECWLPCLWELIFHSLGCYCTRFCRQTEQEPKRKVVLSEVTEHISTGYEKRLTPGQKTIDFSTAVHV